MSAWDPKPLHVCDLVDHERVEEARRQPGKQEQVNGHWSSDTSVVR